MKSAIIACWICFAPGAGCRTVEPPSPAAMGQGDPAPAGAAPAPPVPREVRVQGKLVCIAEELSALYKAQVPPVHDHLPGIRTAEGDLLVLVRTSSSAALFKDPRFQGRELVLAGRTFPRSGCLEVRRFGWISGDGPCEVYYWCETCSIRGVDPGPCACCQGPVEMRERPEAGGPARAVPLPEERFQHGDTEDRA